MSSIDDFNRIDDCEKIDALCINAFVDFTLDQDNPTGICLDTSWGGDCLDLTDVVKAAETCTELYLSPEDNPNCLVYKGECEDFCINGDDLSRIISITKLKDVDQNVAPQNGDVYMYQNGKWVAFNLQSYMDNIANTITNLNALVRQYLNRIQRLEEKLTPPEGAPYDVKVAFGNINLYSDSTNAGLKTSGLYTHSLNEDITNDERFS